jgi:two-component system chemotaxis response regulator CheB
LVGILSADPAIEVIGQAKDGLEAVEMTQRLRPDVVTMDIDMPLLNGFEATKRIMIEAPTPIVIVTGISDTRQVASSMQALSCGALTLLQKPSGPLQRDFDEVCRHTVETVKALSQVKVVGHRLDRRRSSIPPPSGSGRGAIVAIAASTGGPSAVQRIFSELPQDFPLPIVLVQHLARGFVEGFALWLSGACPLRVQVATHGVALQGGAVYVAPDDRHLGVGRNGTALLDSDIPAIGGFKPSGTYLFSSVAKAYGPSAIALILTGMGVDGTVGLRAIKQSGGRVIAQDEDTSVVFGMPASAIAEGLADEVVPLGEISSRLVHVASRIGRTNQKGAVR